jgi:hypothetical protein
LLILPAFPEKTKKEMDGRNVEKVLVRKDKIRPTHSATESGAARASTPANRPVVPRSERQEAGGERGAREYGGDAAGVACAGALWH